MGITRSTGRPLKAGGITIAVAGGGYQGATRELDETVAQAPGKREREKEIVMTDEQVTALTALCERYRVEFSADNFRPSYSLPDGYVAGWVGPIFVGCSPDGRISS